MARPASTSRFAWNRLRDDVRTRCIDGRHAEIAQDRVVATGRRLIPNVYAATHRHAVGDLDRRIADDHVLADLVVRRAWENDDPVRVPDRAVCLNQVVHRRGKDADPEIDRRTRRITVAARLVPPERVVGALKSYAATGKPGGGGTVPDGHVAFDANLR